MFEDLQHQHNYNQDNKLSSHHEIVQYPKVLYILDKYHKDLRINGIFRMNLSNITHHILHINIYSCPLDRNIQTCIHLHRILEVYVISRKRLNLHHISNRHLVL